MSRCFLPLLLAVAYLASQLAAVPHSHAVESTGHSLRAHIHGQTCSSHDHGHCHDHHHDHAHSLSQQSSPDNSAPADHDDNCIYLPDSVTAGMQAKVQLPEIAVACAFCAESSSLLLNARFENTSLSFAPPDVLRSGCDLCLTLRTLRI